MTSSKVKNTINYPKTICDSEQTRCDTSVESDASNPRCDSKMIRYELLMRCDPVSTECDTL